MAGFSRRIYLGTSLDQLWSMECTNVNFDIPLADSRIPNMMLSTVLPELDPRSTSNVPILPQNQEMLCSVSNSHMQAKLDYMSPTLFSDDVQLQVFDFKQSDGKSL